MEKEIVELVIIVGGIFLMFLTTVGVVLGFWKTSHDAWKRSDDQIKEWNQKFYDETKDFHSRLCAIEERRLKEKNE